MYAVIKTGGKQYRVAAGDVIKVEKLDGEVGEKIGFDQVLMVGDEGVEDSAKFGAPVLSGAEVTAEVLEQSKADKVLIFKKKRRKNYRRTRGHRQQQTVLRIGDIKVA
jgi:large subunit ribosomal protein L21